jgi:predicted TPR repeat methyltransferase
MIRHPLTWSSEQAQQEPMPDLSLVLNQAADLHRKGDLAAAERLYLQLLESQPDHFDALQMFGFLRYDQGRLVEALSLIGAAVKARPHLPAALLNYAVVLDALGRREEALATYDRALEIKPDYVEALYNRGIALRDLRRPAEALASFDQVLAIAPNDADTLNNRGNVLRNLSRSAEALASYDRALAIRPNDADLLNNRGNALRDLDRTAEALASYDKALATKPGYVQALNNRASALRKLERPAEALASYDRALAVDPKDSETWSNRGIVFADMARYGDAINDFDHAISLRADFAEAFSNKAKSLLLAGRDEEACAAYGQALTLRPDLVEACLGRADALYRLAQSNPNIRKRLDEAVAAYDRALALKPDLAEGWLGRGNALNNLLKRHGDALAAYDKALTIKPDLAPAWLGRGEALERLRRPQEAIVAYRQALAAGGDAEVIHFALATLGADAVPVTAPREYITGLFDQYADHFDDHLVGKLKYQTPDSLFDAVMRLAPSGNLNVLDLGCGTGLVGARLQPLARTLTGVDISSKMIKVARQRQIYDHLACGELIEFLRTQPKAFDLAVAADVFVYIGDLSGVFKGVRAALRDGGFFGFSVEAGEQEDFMLRATRRYAHSTAYLRRLADDHGFVLETIESHVIRQQDGVDVVGNLAMLRCT